MPDERCIILLAGRIDPRWSHWFEDMTVTYVAGDRTRLEGTIIDEAAFNGLLSKIRDLGLSLLYVERQTDCRK